MHSPLDHERERHLRREQTDAERVLWCQLRNRRLQGWKFRRQHRIGPYFADFVCLEAGLVIELDEGRHPAGLPHDAARCLRHEGFDALRFCNDQVLRETEAVLAAIVIALAPHLPFRYPFPARGQAAGHALFSASPTTAASSRRSG